MKFRSRRSTAALSAAVVIALAGAGAAAAAEKNVIRKGEFAEDVFVSGDHVRVEGKLAEGLYAAGGELKVRASIRGDAQAAGGRVLIADEVAGDVFAAGGQVGIDGRVGESVVVAGGRVNLGAAIGGDVLAAGGRLDVSGPIDGDLRASGGRVGVVHRVGGDALLAGGRVDIGDGATVAGNAIVGAGSFRLNGTIAKNLTVGARKIVIAGVVKGDAHLRADEITILPSARIGGDLVYRSPSAVDTGDDSQVGGDVTFIQSEGMRQRFGGLHAVAGATHLAFVFGLVVAAAVFVLALPALFPALDARLRSRKGRSLGVGFAVLLAGPFVVAMLIVTLIGLPLALVLAGVYVLSAALGFTATAYVLGRKVASALGRELGATAWQRVLVAGGGLLLLGLLALVPVIGALVVILATALGVGALLLEGLDRRMVRSPVG